MSFPINFILLMVPNPWFMFFWLFSARKINIGKFQHKKTNVMVVTDVAVSKDVLFTMSLSNSPFPADFFSIPFERGGGGLNDSADLLQIVTQQADTKRLLSFLF